MTSLAKPTPLNTVNTRQRWLTLMILAGAWALAHLCFWLLPNVFEPWDARTVDQLFVWRDAIPALRPAYDNTIVHVDLNDSSISRLQTFYLDRQTYARVIDNLTAMGVAAQVHDFIFAAPTVPDQDQALIKATTRAGNVYFGVALALNEPGKPARQSSARAEDVRYLQETTWPVVVAGAPQRLYNATPARVSFAALARAAHGQGQRKRGGSLRWARCRTSAPTPTCATAWTPTWTPGCCIS